MIAHAGPKLLNRPRAAWTIASLFQGLFLRPIFLHQLPTLGGLPARPAPVPRRPRPTPFDVPVLYRGRDARGNPKRIDPATLRERLRAVG